MNLNVSYIANNAIQNIMNNQSIEFYEWIGFDNSLEEVVPQYANPINYDVNVQLANNQDLQYIDGWSSTKIYRNFWINSQISGYDWQKQIGQSYIVFDNVKHYIVKVVNDFRTGFTLVVGCQANG